MFSMSAPLSVNDIVREVCAASAVLAAQRPLLEAPQLRKTGAALATSIINHMADVPWLDAVNAEALTNAVMSSVFEPEERQKIVLNINNKIGCAPPAGSNGQKSTQRILTVLDYFTAGDWDILFDASKTLEQKLVRMVGRLVLLGLRNPSESSVKSLVAMLAAAHCPSSGSQELYGIVKSVKNAVEAHKADPWGFPHVILYPASPVDLPKEIYDHAYTVEDPPTTKALPAFAFVLNKVCI